MIRERDFNQVTFKLNTSGSWANLVTCDSKRIDEVKAACVAIAQAGCVKFKYVDAAGGTIEEYAGRLGGWCEPKRGR